METIACEADAMDALDQIEDALGSFGLMAELLESQSEDAHSCLFREMVRLSSARMDQVAALREYAQKCFRNSPDPLA